MVPLPKPKTDHAAKPAAEIDNYATIEDHVRLLHERADGIDGVLVVSVFHANPSGPNDSPGTIVHHPVGDIEGMVDAITAHAEVDGANAYLGLQVMRKGLPRGKRGQESDIVAVLGLVADMDADTGKASGTLPMAPSYMIETSPGNLQPAWIFDRPLSVAEAKPLAAALRRATGSDAGTADVSHVWRVPGTLNWPNAKKLSRGRPLEPAEVRLHQAFSGLINVEAFTAALEPWMRADSVAAVAIDIGDLPDVSDVALDSEMEEMLGADGQPDRSAHAAKVVEALAFRGHSVEAATAICLNSTGEWTGRYKDEAALRRDIARVWAKFGVVHETKPVDTTALLARAGGEATTDADSDVDLPDFVLDAIGLEDLSRPGGLVEDLIDWITSSAEQPSRTLALAAVIPLIAAVAGSRYSTGDRDTRPNIYTVALAPSGFGKEHARSQIKRLLMESQGVLDRFGGPARIMSASALREVLEANPSVNCQIDEFGGFIRDITDRNAGGHQRAISTDLRDYYSASVTYFEGAAYRGSPPKRIYNPNLCIHGTSTPEQFWNALSSASAEDGLLPRLVLFHVKGAKPATAKPARNVRWVPLELLNQLAEVAGIDVSTERTAFLRGKGALGATTKPPGPNKPIVVNWTEDAQDLFALIKETVEDREQKASAEQQPFIRRILENAVKLALIVAVGTDPADPEITERDIEWGASVAWSCAATMLEQVSERLADNQREANYKRISGLIKGAGPAGITHGRLVDRLKAIEARQREEIIKDLKTSGKVVDFTKPSKGRPSVRLVWAAMAA